MRAAVKVAVLLLVELSPTSHASARPGDDAPRPSEERPAEITQVWPQHANGASLPSPGKDRDPNCPTGGRLWRWQVVPRRPAAETSRVCRLEIVPTRKGAGGGSDDASVHLAGELTTSQRTSDGRDFWASDSTRGVWSTNGCARALPEEGFTFEVSVTKKELAKAETRRVRFDLGNEASTTRTSVEVWTDPFGEKRAVPLTAPVTPVGLLPRWEATKVAPADVGLRGIAIVRGSRATVDVADEAAPASPFTVYASLERDLEDDDPSPSGLRATRAGIPASRRLRVEATTKTLDAAGKASFTIAVPDDAAAVGLSFYVQVGVGADAVAGLSCALACTIVASLADYDGDGRPNAKDAAPLDPEK